MGATTPSIPTFLIVGAMKAGTTSLFDYLMQHPRLVRGRQKELHFLDWRWAHVSKVNLDVGTQSVAKAILERRGDPDQNPMSCKYLQFFNVEALSKDDSLGCGDGSPSYIMGGRTVCQRIKAVAPGAKIIIIIRDPVKRAISHYNMCADPNGTPGQLRKRGNLSGRTFSQVVDEDIALLTACGAHDAHGMNDERFQKEYLDKLPYGHG